MTSIPMPELPPRPPEVPAWKRRAFWLQLLVGGLVGGVVSYSVVKATGALRGADAIVMIVGFIATGWLQVVLHEAGHALAGMAMGLQPLALGVGPLRAERGATGWRVNWSRSIRGIGGFAILLPREGAQTPRQTAAYLLGGPLSNLLAAGLAWLAIASGTVVAMPWLALAWINVAIGLLLGLTNLVPFLAGGWSSDGRQLLKLWQGSDESRAASTLSRLAGLMMLGVRPRDWPASLSIDLPLDDLPQGVADALARCQVLRAIDARRHEDAIAAKAAARLAEGFWDGPDGLRQVNAMLLARWVLDATGNADRADAWLAHSEGGLVDQTPQRAVLRARIAIARGEHDKAREQLAIAQETATRVPDAAGRAMLAEGVAEVVESLARAPARGRGD